MELDFVVVKQAPPARLHNKATELLQSSIRTSEPCQQSVKQILCFCRVADRFLPLERVVNFSALFAAVCLRPLILPAVISSMYETKGLSN
jgi:hypothetical protein